jgi:hypothetical protein
MLQMPATVQPASGTTDGTRTSGKAFAAASVLAAALMLAAAPAAAQVQGNGAPPPQLPHGLRPNNNGVYGAPGSGGSSLPPTPPTSAQAMQTARRVAPVAAPIAATPDGVASVQPRRARVTVADGMVDVRANDSSLNQILRAISRETGMKITGGVADQRVFGNYGPASLSVVLATLLDGTGTNILYLAGGGGTPPSLTLTPRGGGPTPPSPSAVPDDSVEDAAGAQPVGQPTAVRPATAPVTPAASAPAAPQAIPLAPNSVMGSQYNTTPTASTFPTTHSVPLDSVASPTTAQPVNGIVDSPNPPGGPTPAPGTPAATGGALTPEQVYQQLMKMQQNQQAQPASTTTAPASTPPLL